MKKTLVQFAFNPLNYSNRKTKPRFLANQTPIITLTRQQKKGIFRQKNPTPPWEWRKKKRAKNEKQSNENKNSNSKKAESESSGCILT